jgi:hypothetical protein
MSLIRTTALCGLLAVFSVPAWLSAPAWAEGLAPQALNSLSALPAQAASAKLFDQNGRLLGEVERIQTDQDGKPSALAFRTSRGIIVVISAAAVSYDGKVLIAGNDQPQIAAILQPQLRTALAE